MEPRLDYKAASPNAFKAMLALEAAVGKLGIEPSLLELIKLRASQLNGCAFCVDMHATDALKAGETPRRLNAVAVWREAPFFTARERTALAWTESLTLLPQTHASDEDYEQLRAQFSESEMVNISLAICTINSWNRLAVGFRAMPPA
ncbi:MAG TPA: carboxymuconolactone decarboxylase family protein [Eoetvoesiella sp.]